MGEMANDVEVPTFKGEGTKAKVIFEELARLLPTHGEAIVSKVQAVFLFKVFNHGVYNRPTAQSQYAFWVLDLKNGSGTVRQTDKSEPCDLMFFGSDDNFENIMTGLQNPPVEFFRGHFVAKGKSYLLAKLRELKPLHADIRAKL
ncbi:Non-specific lipid-transfer protein [Trichoplax sp. H2]|uniref:SCP2 domain-containing protein n=1 Tax=Trichoplax adhaerens TaxID=10228 RepID=B3S4X5_TRIAD|nr:hypothetical protein TRIADDRAFT_59382 [Trichoplax adhaerens]EDV22282.1 hypothetical protein TRIADDRAFT_59382 [Trichoplax adhaerens]RDD42264.1 Non-specific lipid-transfer protein [Trichoplax sp. H2]|eukprot:XP_002115437.1 hypothetical protein TRIADDRAFT_59382 [Trichoplax adhaerens]